MRMKKIKNKRESEEKKEERKPPSPERQSQTSVKTGFEIDSDSQIISDFSEYKNLCSALY